MLKKDIQIEQSISNVTQQIEELSSCYVAGILKEDGYLLPMKFEIYKSLMENLYSFKLVEDAVLRVRILTNLVNPETNNEVFPKLLQNTVQVHTTVEIRRTIIDYILLARAENMVFRPKRIEELDALIKAFGLIRTEFTERID